MRLDRCKLTARAVRAYMRQASAYAASPAAHADDHTDALAGLVGAEGAVTAGKRELLSRPASPAAVSLALAAVTLRYEQADFRIPAKRVRIPRPGEPGRPDRLMAAAFDGNGR